MRPPPKRERPVRYRNLPATSFPFTARFYDDDTDELLHTIVVEAPGVMDIPGWAPRRVRVTMDFADGTSITERP